MQNKIFSSRNHVNLIKQKYLSRASYYPHLCAHQPLWQINASIKKDKPVTRKRPLAQSESKCWRAKHKIFSLTDHVSSPECSLMIDKRIAHPFGSSLSDAVFFFFFLILLLCVYLKGAFLRLELFFGDVWIFQF